MRTIFSTRKSKKIWGCSVACQTPPAGHTRSTVAWRGGMWLATKHAVGTKINIYICILYTRSSIYMGKYKWNYLKT